MPIPQNVLFITADQFRWDCLGAAGNPVIRTPNLDALAAEGVLFSNCFVQTLPCGPSRMCIFTSRYLCSTRVTDNMTPLVDAHENLAMHLCGAGLVPGFLGYNDYAIDPRILSNGDPRKERLSYDNTLPGFHTVLYHEHDSPEYFKYLRDKGYPDELCCPKGILRYDVPPEGPGDHLPLRYPAVIKAEDSECQFLTSAAINYMRGRAGQGWALSLNYIKPHPTRICPAPYNDMYDPADMPPVNRRAEELSDPHPYLRMMHTEPRLTNERDLRETQACYYGMITEIDSCIGRLTQALKELGQWDNTLIIFSSDHSEYLGAHWDTDKAHFYDETMRVPYIVRDPSPEADATRGRPVSGFCESIDSAPTILDFLGFPIPARFQGTSLLPLLRNHSGAKPKRRIHFEQDFRGRFRSNPDIRPEQCLLWVVRDERFKYVQFGLEFMPPMLFDLKADPGEHINLAQRPEHAATVAEYCQTLLRWRMRNEDQRMEQWASQYR